MYCKSVSAGPQAAAMKQAAHLWGEGPIGGEEIPFPVCKRKYQPWKVTAGNVTAGNVTATSDGRDGSKGDVAESNQMMFACHLHHKIRFKRIQRYGMRSGWESFDTWHKSDEVAPKGPVPEETSDVAFDVSDASLERPRKQPRRG
mmetsp:Transcript_30261/g.36744  ORF Transcript_30261/g.36744 Transcript_30261/m.36744 type:complete len:145 (+) Transcript_30261:181-615(+)